MVRTKKVVRKPNVRTVFSRAKTINVSLRSGSVTDRTTAVITLMKKDVPRPRPKNARKTNNSRELGFFTRFVD